MAGGFGNSGALWTATIGAGGTGGGAVVFCATGFEAFDSAAAVGSELAGNGGGGADAEGFVSAAAVGVAGAARRTVSVTVATSAVVLASGTKATSVAAVLTTENRRGWADFHMAKPRPTIAESTQKNVSHGSLRDSGGGAGTPFSLRAIFWDSIQPGATAFSRASAARGAAMTGVRSAGEADAGDSGKVALSISGAGAGARSTAGGAPGREAACGGLGDGCGSVGAEGAMGNGAGSTIVC